MTGADQLAEGWSEKKEERRSLISAIVNDQEYPIVHNLVDALEAYLKKGLREQGVSGRITQEDLEFAIRESLRRFHESCA
jgi:hypothetical protein